MKINKISINDFAGIKNVELEITAPILLLAGHNGAGKSSIVEGSRLALSSQMSRVNKKKELYQLVHRGAEKGSVKIDTTKGKFNVNLPTGSGKSFSDWRLGLALNHGYVTDMELSRQQQLAFNLSESAIPAEKILEVLKAKGFETEALQINLEDIKQASAECSDFAKQSRAAWQSITGERYGSSKANTWVHPVLAASQSQTEPTKSDNPWESCPAQSTSPEQSIMVSDMGSLTKKLESLQKQQAELQKLRDDKQRTLSSFLSMQSKLGMLNEQIQEAKNSEAILANLHEDVSAKKEYLAKLNFISEQGKTYKCPCCENILVINNGTLVEVSSEVKAKLDEYLQSEKISFSDVAEIPSIKTQIENINKAIGATEQKISRGSIAQKQLSELSKETLDEKSIATEIAGLDSQIEKVKKEQSKINNEVIESSKQAQQIANQKASENTALENAKKATQEARRMHSMVVRWGKLEDLLTKKGAITALFEQAVKPFNNLLGSVQGSNDWEPVEFDYNSGFMMGGKPYHLLSESEQWRVDTIISYAIASKFEVGMFAIDRFDLLDVVNRKKALVWLQKIVKSGEIEQIIIAGTFKEKPSITLPEFQIEWVENGKIC